MNASDKTLIILTPGFPKDETDTTCLPSQQLFVQSLKKNYPGLNLVVLSFFYPAAGGQYSWNNVPVILFNGEKYGKLFRFLLWRKVYKTLRRLQKSHNIAGILSFWCGECALVGNCFAKKFNVDHRIWILGQDARKQNKLVRWIRPEPNELIALSDFLADEFYRNHHIKPLHMIPNGIDPDLFGTQPPAHEFDILGAGSLIPLKQYTLFVDAVFQLKRSFPAIKACLIGKGPEEIALRKKIKTLGLEKNIVLTGEIPHQEVLRYMQRSGIFVHPSSYEGYSTVCLEALYAGCSVVSFTAPETRTSDRWHVVQTQEELVDSCRLLLTERREHQPVVLHTMKDSVVKMMALFRL